MDLQNFINQTGRYPVSTETLDILQQQIFLAARLAEAVTGASSHHIIITPATTQKDGLVLINGELLPLEHGTPKQRIRIVEESADITAAGTTFTGAVIKRKAQYHDSEGTLVSAFSRLETMSAMHDRITEHSVPKGTIIDWCGTFDAASIPYGWLPCCRVPVNDGHWEELYDAYDDQDIPIEKSTPDGGGYFRFTQCNGVTIPDLTGRFTLGADEGTQGRHLGDTGGSYTHDLMLSETPRQSGTVNEGSGRSTTLVTTENYYPAAVDVFSIMPPYVALVKLIKII